MAFLGILLADILLVFILGTTFVALVFFIISMILFSKTKKTQEIKKKMSAIVTLVISIILFLPAIISIAVLSMTSIIQDTKEKQVIESIENKVIVKRDEWKNGFEYDGKNLVPIHIFMNSDNYKSRGSFKNLNKIGALVIEHTNRYYSLYELDNDSGYKIYFVWVESFAGGEYYSRTFVDKNEYDAVLEYYNTTNLKVSAMWKSAPEYTNLRNAWTSLDLNIDDKRDELIKLSHEVLDDVSEKKMVSTSTENYDECMMFQIKSTDKVFTIDLVIYTKDDEMKLYLNGYEVEEKITLKYKDMLRSLTNDAQKELLQSAKEKSSDFPIKRMQDTFFFFYKLG